MHRAHHDERDGRHQEMDKGSDKWIQKAIKKPGALHKALDVPKDEKIPMSKIEKAEHSKNPKLRKRAFLAETLKKMH